MKTSGRLETYSIFSLGIFCTIAFRSLTILKTCEPSLVRPMWYAGVIGYFVFFLYRFHISSKRRRAVRYYRLVETVRQDTFLTGEQRDAMLYLLGSIEKSKENINYFAIFFFSIIAILVDMAFCLSGK